MRSTGSSQIEYQGLSIVKKDYKKLEALLKKYYPNAKMKQNLHICLDYFGTKQHIDKHLEKEKKLFPSKALGKQLEIPIIGIADYYKDGKLMNVALLIDDEVFYDVKIGEDKTLANYNNTACPCITLYVANDTFIDEKNRVRPVTAVKKSSKCFNKDELKDGEISHFVDLTDITVTGEIAAFNKQNAIYRIHDNSTRLTTNKSIREVINDVMNLEIENEYEKEEKKKIEEAKSKLFG